MLIYCNDRYYDIDDDVNPYIFAENMRNSQEIYNTVAAQAAEIKELKGNIEELKYQFSLLKSNMTSSSSKGISTRELNKIIEDITDDVSQYVIDELNKATHKGINIKWKRK